VVVGGALILVAMAVVAVTGFYSSQEAYYTVDDFVHAAEADTYRAPDGRSARRLQLRGKVEGQTVSRPADGLGLEFDLEGKDATVPVVYEGVVPDTFDMAESVTVGGVFGADGVFLADQLFVQCPSKYEAVPPGESASSG
jgi:cytochrome c-type biogenesis protein CcmE